MAQLGKHYYWTKVSKLPRAASETHVINNICVTLLTVKKIYSQRVQEILKENTNHMILALLGALVINVYLAFSLKLPSYDFNEFSKKTSTKLEVKLVTYIEDKISSLSEETMDTPTNKPIASPADKTEIQKSSIKTTDAVSEPEEIVINYRDLKKWIESDTTRILDQENRHSFDSKIGSKRPKTFGYGTVGDINREQIILGDGGVVTSYESGLYSVDVKTKMFGKDICYKFDHNCGDFCVVTPYRCPKKDVIQLNIK